MPSSMHQPQRESSSPLCVRPARASSGPLHQACRLPGVVAASRHRGHAASTTPVVASAGANRASGGCCWCMLLTVVAGVLAHRPRPIGRDRDPAPSGRPPPRARTAPAAGASPVPIGSLRWTMAPLPVAVNRHDVGLLGHQGPRPGRLRPRTFTLHPPPTLIDAVAGRSQHAARCRCRWMTWRAALAGHLSPWAATGQQGPPTTRVCAYDPGTDRWSARASLQWPVLAVAVALDGRLHLVVAAARPGRRST